MARNIYQRRRTSRNPTTKQPEHDGFDDPELLQAFKVKQSEQAKQLLEAQIDKAAAAFAGTGRRSQPTTASTSTSTFAEPGLLQAQQAQAEMQNTPYLSIKSQPVKVQTPEQKNAQLLSLMSQPTKAQPIMEQQNTPVPLKNSTSVSHAAFADPGLLQAEKLDKKNQYGVKVDALIKMAESQLNTLEGPNNDNPYGTWYKDPNTSWCAQFASWCANQVGSLNTDIEKSSYGIPKNESTAHFVEDYKKIKRFAYGFSHAKDQDNAYKPKAGDFVFFDWGNGQRHTGIVIAFDEKTNTVYTIEGNSGENSNGVFYHERAFKSSNIIGYGINGGTSYGTAPY